jgi:superfamily II DNA or RNA helicase
LKENNLEFDINNQRLKLEDIKFENNIKLFPYQTEAIDKIINNDSGVLVAPPGSGKTIIGLDIIAKQKQPALILVHKKQIFNQWLERIEGFLNIPKREIGQYAANKKKLGKKITVAMVQTLNNIENQNELVGKFGLILVDECHHMPARMFRNVITKFNPYYLYGLTATPKRKNNDTNLIFIYLGNIIHTIPAMFGKTDTIERNDRITKPRNNLEVIIKETNLALPFKMRTDNIQTLYKIITFDTQRNQQIIDDIKNEAGHNRRCLVLTERKEHVEVLNYYLKREYETITMTGDLTYKQRKIKVKQIQSGHFKILIATGQLIGEGTDFNNLDCLFLAYPFAFEGKLIQYIGRINRGLNTDGAIYDYNDIKIEYLNKFFKKRRAYYRKNYNLV